MAWCSRWPGNWGSRSSAHSTIGSATPTSRTVAPLRLRLRPRLSICRPGSRRRCRPRSPGRRLPALFALGLGPLLRPDDRQPLSSLCRSARQRQPRRLPGRHRSSARISDRRSLRARRPLWRLWRRERRRGRPRHQSGGDRLCPHPHWIDEPQLPGRRAATGRMSGPAAGISTPCCKGPGITARPAPSSPGLTPTARASSPPWRAAIHSLGRNSGLAS